MQKSHNATARYQYSRTMVVRLLHQLKPPHRATTVNSPPHSLVQTESWNVLAQLGGRPTTAA